MIEGIVLVGLVAFVVHFIDSIRLLMMAFRLGGLKGEQVISEAHLISAALASDLNAVVVEREGKTYLRRQLFVRKEAEPALFISRDVRRMLPLVLLGIGLLIGPSEQISAFEELTRPILLGVALNAFLLQGFSENRYANAVQRWLHSLHQELPVLPEGTGGVRDLLHQLSTQYQEMQNFNNGLAKQMEKSQKILSELSTDLQLSFKKSVDAQLAPSLEEMTKLAVQTQTASRRFVDETSQKQNQAVQTMISQVMQGIDQAIGQNLRDTSESFATSVQRQQVSMDRWRRSIDSVSEVIGSLEGATKSVTLGAEKMAKAAQPVEVAANVFAASASQLEQALPAIADVANIYQNSQKILEDSHRAIASGTKEYRDIAGTIETMVQGLQLAHQNSIETISRGVDEAILNAMKEAGQQLTSVQKAQAEGLDKWTHVSGNLNITMTELQDTAVALATVSKELVQASEPTVVASKYFYDAAHQLQESIQPLQETIGMHEAGKEALQLVVNALRDESERYGASAKVVHGIVEQLETTQKDILLRLQEQLDRAIADNLVRASNLLENSVNKASERLENSSEKTAQTLEGSMDNFAQNLNMAGEKTIQTFEVSLQKMSERLEGSSEKTAQSLEGAMNTISERLEQSGEKTAHSLEQSLVRSSSEMTTSLREARSQLRDSISDTINQFEHALSSASEALIENWGETGKTIQEAMEHSSQALDQSVQEVGKKLNIRVDEAGRSLEMSAQASAESILEGAREAKVLLSDVGGNWSTSIQTASDSLLGSAKKAGAVLEHSFDGVEERLDSSFVNIGKNMANNLQEIHQKYAHSLDYSTQNLRVLADLQAGHSDGWKELLDNLKPALANLKNSTQDLNEIMQGLRGSVEPVQEASLNFKEASHNITAVFPNISDTAENYHRFNQSLIEATKSLSTTAVQYVDAGEDMAKLLVDIQHSMDLQNHSNNAVNQTLSQAEQTIRSLEPVTESMRQAAGDIKLISEQTTNTVDTIQKAASAQNQTVQQMGKLSAQLLKTIGMQSNRLNQVTDQMSLLQDVLTNGVQAFAKTLPKSVDQTLVSFDQALGEGVARLGVAIERLREAMDDLIEELELRK